MIPPFHLYISAGADLGYERDLLSRAVTNIPLDLAWKIVLSPLKNELLDQDALATSDLHILILGGDIRAPIGLEHRFARLAGRRPHLFLRGRANQTMAAVNFRNYLGIDDEWQTYHEGDELRVTVLRLLTRRILELAVRFELSPLEMEQIHSWVLKLEEEKRESADMKGGAGDSSLILSLKRYSPSEGILLGLEGQNSLIEGNDEEE